MVLLRTFKSRNENLHHETQYMTVDSFARWSQNNRTYPLSCLLPIGVLTLIALKGGITSGVNLHTFERPFNDFTLPEYTLKSAPISEAELFYLAHKSVHIPTFNAGQFGIFFDKIIKTRDILFHHYLGRNMHAYVETMSKLCLSESIVALENDIEFHDYRGMTIGAYITAYLSDLKSRILNYGLIQKMAEINIPVSRVCHVFQSKWNPKKDIKNQFVLNELGYNMVSRLYKDNVTTSLVECVGSVDLCIQDPEIGYLGMRLNGFDTDRPKSQPLETDLSAIICTPKPLYVDYDSDPDFTDSLSLPDRNLHISCSKTPAKKKNQVETAENNESALSDKLADMSDKVADLSGQIMADLSKLPILGRQPTPEKAVNQHMDSVTDPFDINRPGPSAIHKIKKKKSGPPSPCPTARHTPIPMFAVKIGPGRWVETQGLKFSKSNIPFELRNDMITEDGLGVVYVDRNGLVKLNGINEGILGQDGFAHLGEIRTSCNMSGDVDMLEISDPSQSPDRNPPPVCFGPNVPDYSHPESESNSQPIVRTKVKTIGPSQNSSRSQNRVCITDASVQTSQKSKLTKNDHFFNFYDKPAENIFTDMIKKQKELNGQYAELLEKFQIDIVNLPVTLAPNQAQLIKLIKQADDLAESLNSGSSHVKNTRETIITMIMDLLQSAIGTSLDDAQTEIRRLNNENRPISMTHRLLESFTRQNLKNVWQIMSRPAMFTANQDQKSLEMQIIYEKYTPTIETHKAALVQTFQTAEKEALEVLNREPTQPEEAAKKSLSLFEKEEDSDLDIVPETPPSGHINEIKIGTKRHTITHRYGVSPSKYQKKK